MKIKNSIALEFIDRIQAVQKSDALSKVQAELQTIPDETLRLDSLKVIIDEYLDASSSSVKHTLASFTSNQEKTLRENLVSFLAENREFSEAVNARLAENPRGTDLYFTGLNKSIVGRAVAADNVFFCVLGLKTVDKHLVVTSISDQYSMLHDGVIALAEKKANMQPIHAHLETIRAKYGEASVRWKNFEGQLFSEINEIQRKSFEGGQAHSKPILFASGSNESSTATDSVSASAEKISRHKP